MGLALEKAETCRYCLGEPGCELAKELVAFRSEKVDDCEVQSCRQRHWWSAKMPDSHPGRRNNGYRRNSDHRITRETASPYPDKHRPGDVRTGIPAVSEGLYGKSHIPG